MGSDYIYPRTCNKIAKPAIANAGGKVLGEEYAPLGHTEFSSIINKIKAAKPDCIYSTVVGGSNVAFYKQLRAAGLDGTKQTLLSTVVSENEIEGIGKDNAAGYYACMGYFQSIKNPVNERSSRPSRRSTEPTGSSAIRWRWPTTASISGRWPSRRPSPSIRTR